VIQLTDSKKMKVHIAYIALVVITGIVAYSFGNKDVTKMKDLTAWSLINERLNGGLVMAESIRREDTEDSLKFAEGQIITELLMLGNEEYAYSSLRRKFFEDGIMHRIETYVEKYPDSDLASSLKEYAIQAE
jgi:hypothetical protein